MELEPELADEVYVFSSKNLPGIRFYDRNPDASVHKIVGEVPSGVYYTDAYSADLSVAWDDKLNTEGPEKQRKIRYRDGSNTVTTYIVSPKKLQELIAVLSKAKQNGERIRIDINERTIADIKREIAEADKANKLSTSDLNASQFILEDNEHDKFQQE